MINSKSFNGTKIAKYGNIVLLNIDYFLKAPFGVKYVCVTAPAFSWYALNTFLLNLSQPRSGPLNDVVDIKSSVGLN